MFQDVRSIPRGTNPVDNDSYHISLSPQYHEDGGVDSFMNTYQPDQMEYDGVYEPLAAQRHNQPSRFQNYAFHNEEEDVQNQASVSYIDSLNLDLPEVAHTNTYDVRSIRREPQYDPINYPAGFDSPYAMRGHRNAYSSLSQNLDISSRRFDAPPANPYYYPSVPDYVENRASMRGEVDPLLYSLNTPRQTNYMSDSRMHSRINSSPGIHGGSMYHDDYYSSRRGYSNISASDVHFRHSSEIIPPSDSYVLRSEHHRRLHSRDSLDSNYGSNSPSAPAVPVPSSPHNVVTQSEASVVKLPYACRDFRNGTCTRGEKCRFIHVLDGRRVRGK